MGNKIFLISMLIVLLTICLVSASDVLVWQGQYYTGTTFNIGTYEFNFSVYDDLTGGDICYSNTTSLTTGSFGEWKTEQYDVSSSCSNTSKDYFLNININGTDQIPRKRITAWNFLRKNTDEITTGKLQIASQIIAPLIQANSQIVSPIINATQIVSDNLTTTNYGFFSFLGSLTNRITKLFVRDIDASGNITAQYFIGDGSLLTGISAGGNSSWNESYANTKYLDIASINQSCPVGYLLSGHLVNSSGVFNNCSTKDLNYYKKLAAFSGKVGNGIGDETNFYMGNWNVIPYEVVSDPGNNWDDTEYWYTVPYDGTYSVSYFVRTTDGTPLNTGYAITLNIEGTSEDNPDFTKWTAVVSDYRSSDGRVILGYHFTKGQNLRVLVYQDETDTYSCSDASLQIILDSLD